MNKIKKISAAALAAALMTGTALTVNAEESQPKLLIAEDFSTENLLYCGDGYLRNSDGFFRLGKEELAKWRETGNLEPVKIESDIDTSELSRRSGNFNGNYIQFSKDDDEGYATERYILRLDKEAGKIRKLLTRSDWCFTSPYGYNFFCEQDGNDLYVMVQNLTGNTITGPVIGIEYSGAGGIQMYGYEWIGSYNDDIIGYVKCQTDMSEDDYCSIYELNAVKKDGELELIYKNDSLIEDFRLVGTASNGILFYEISDADNHFDRWKYKIYSTDSNKVYEVGNAQLGGSDWYMFIEGIASDLYGTKAIIYGNSHTSTSAENEYSGYVLVNLNENTKADVVSNRYKYMGTNDGEIYLVQTEDEKWGYIDSNGKELAIFDDAGTFYGDFAPVVKDGKAYLIDRNMNKVSEAIDGEGVTAYGEGLYTVTVNGEKKFMTYAAKPTASKPTEPTSEPTSGTTSEPASTDDKNPATGVPGIAVAVGTLALAAGAVVVAKKRK